MSTKPYFSGLPNEHNISSRETHDYQTPPYAATIAITVTKNKTLVNVGQLTGALTLSAVLPTAAADDNRPFVGDDLDFIFSADTSNRVVTFGTGFASPGPITVAANKPGKAFFKFNGIVWVGSGVVTI